MIDTTPSYLSDYNPGYPPSDLSADDVSDLWLDPTRMRNSGGGGRRSMLSSSFGAGGEGSGAAAMSSSSQVKRFHPSAFFGSRGKRQYGGPTRAFDSRGFPEEEGLMEEARGDQGAYLGGGGMVAKRFDPSGFSGSRGKRYMPGLEALLLSQMYKKCEY